MDTQTVIPMAHVISPLQKPFFLKNRRRKAKKPSPEHHLWLPKSKTYDELSKHAHIMISSVRKSLDLKKGLHYSDSIH